MSIETQRSNFTLLVSTDFDINTESQLIIFTFSEPIVIPPDLLFFVDGKLFSIVIIDKFIGGSLPNIDKGQQFRLDLGNFITPPPNSNTTCYITILNLQQDQIPMFAQKSLIMPSSEGFSDNSFNLATINSIDPSFYVYSMIELNLNMSLIFANIQVGDILRVMLPNDFPPNYYFDSQNVSCLVTVGSDIQNTTYPFKCKMKGTNVDITSNVLINNDQMEMSLEIKISNIMSSLNFGESGDFKVALLNSTFFTKALNFDAYDSYKNPIILQKQLEIIKTDKTSGSQSINSIQISKGAIKQLYLQTKDLVTKINN